MHLKTLAPGCEEHICAAAASSQPAHRCRENEHPQSRLVTSTLAITSKTMSAQLLLLKGELAC